MAKRKPKIGDRVFWQSEGGPREFGTILEVSASGNRVQVKWDKPPEFYDEQDVFTYDLAPSSGVQLVERA